MYMESLPAQARHLPFLGQADLIENIEAATLRAFVRGVLPVESLKDAGLRTAKSPAGAISLKAADIAAGLITLRPHAAQLAEWASFMLLIAERFAFAPEEAACGERLVTELWDLAFGAPLKDSTLRLALSLHARSTAPRQAA